MSIIDQFEESNYTKRRKEYVINEQEDKKFNAILKKAAFPNAPKNKGNSQPKGIKTNRTHSIALPENCKIKGDLIIFEQKLFKFPDYLEINGNLYIVNSSIAKVPKELYVSKNLVLSNIIFEDKALPESYDLDYNKYYYQIDDSWLNFNMDIKLVLPARVKVSKTFLIDNVKDVKFPKRFETSNLVISRSPIDNLPDIKLNGFLTLNKTKVAYIPVNYSLNTLTIHKTKIKSIPSGVYAGIGNLSIYRTRITKLPENCTKINGNLILKNTLIQNLPEGLIVNGKMILDYSENQKDESKIKKLPNNLRINRTLTLINTDTNILSENLYVLGSLILKNCTISTFPKKITIRGTLGIKNCVLSDSDHNKNIVENLRNLLDYKINIIVF